MRQSDMLVSCLLSKSASAFPCKSKAFGQFKWILAGLPVLAEGSCSLISLPQPSARQGPASKLLPLPLLQAAESCMHLRCCREPGASMAQTQLAVLDSAGGRLATYSTAEVDPRLEYDQQLNAAVWDSRDGWWLLLPTPEHAKAFQGERPGGRAPAGVMAGHSGGIGAFGVLGSAALSRLCTRYVCT